MEQQTKTGLFEGDNLLNTIVSISKGAAYDAIAPQMQKLQEENAKLREALQPFIKLADAVLADTLKTSESPLYGYNDVVLYVKDLVAAKQAIENNQK